MTSDTPDSDDNFTSKFRSIINRVFEGAVHPRAPGQIALEDVSEIGAALPESLDIDEKDIEAVLPIVEQAVNIGNHLRDKEADLEEKQQILDQQPYGVFIVSQGLAVVSGNRKGEEILSLLQKSHPEFSVAENGARNLPKHVSDAVSAAIEQDICIELDRNLLGLNSDYRVMVLPGADTGASMMQSDMIATIFFFEDSFDFEHLNAQLQGKYQLTPSEATTVTYLVQGLSFEQISTVRNIQVETIRTQIKKVFSKTHTNRQAELVSLVLLGEPFINHQIRRRNMSGSSETSVVSKVQNISCFEMSDGHRIGYAEYGAADGTPVVFFNYLLGNAHFIPANFRRLENQGVRLICVDRRGAGLTHLPRAQQIADWADHLNEFVDNLGLTRFSLFGFASGGPFAAACAARLQDRVLSLGLASPMPAFFEIKDSCKVDLSYRFLIKLAQHSPKAFRALVANRYGNGGNHPSRVFEVQKTLDNDPDYHTMTQPWVKERVEMAFADLPLRSLEDIVDEIGLFMKPWGMSLSDILVPTLVWHTGHDYVMPASHIEAMANIIPNCRRSFFKEKGHLEIFNSFHDMLDELMEINQGTDKNTTKLSLV